MLEVRWIHPVSALHVPNFDGVVDLSMNWCTLKLCLNMLKRRWTAEVDSFVSAHYRIQNQAVLDLVIGIVGGLLLLLPLN